MDNNVFVDGSQRTDANESHFIINVELGELGERALCFELIPVKSPIWTKVEKIEKSPKKSFMVKIG